MAGILSWKRWWRSVRLLIRKTFGWIKARATTWPFQSGQKERDTSPAGAAPINKFGKILRCYRGDGQVIPSSGAGVSCTFVVAQASNGRLVAECILPFDPANFLKLFKAPSETVTRAGTTTDGGSGPDTRRHRKLVHQL